MNGEEITVTKCLLVRRNLFLGYVRAEIRVQLIRATRLNVDLFFLEEISGERIELLNCHGDAVRHFHFEGVIQRHDGLNPFRALRRQRLSRSI